MGLGAAAAGQTLKFTARLLFTYISPKRPGLDRSREISAYMVTLGRSMAESICCIAVLSAIQICRGPRRTMGPYLAWAFSTLFQTFPVAKP